MAACDRSVTYSLRVAGSCTTMSQTLNGFPYGEACGTCMVVMATTVPFRVVPQVGQFGGALQALVKVAQDSIPRASRIFDFMKWAPCSEAELHALEDDNECLRRSTAHRRGVFHAVHV